MDDLIGKILVHRYEIQQLLGEGGMASVYLGHDHRLDCQVAIKILQPALQSKAAFLLRFEQEAAAMAKLTHPNIVKVTDFGEQNEVHFLIMEYLSGGSLLDRMDGPMPYYEAARLLAPIAGALAHAHRKKMIHCDIKPGNILFTSDGDPMLSDFGIMTMMRNEEQPERTVTGNWAGTPQYMAPEQWRGRPVFASDQYSLGVVFYEMITGEVPFSADTPIDIAFKQKAEPVPSPRGLIPDLPEEVEVVLLKSLAKQPQDRYPSMAGFKDALEKIAREEIKPVTPPHIEEKSDEVQEIPPPAPLPLEEKQNEVQEIPPPVPLPLEEKQDQVEEIPLPIPPVIINVPKLDRITDLPLPVGSGRRVKSYPTRNFILFGLTILIFLGVYLVTQFVTKTQAPGDEPVAEAVPSSAEPLVTDPVSGGPTSPGATGVSTVITQAPTQPQQPRPTQPYEIKREGNSLPLISLPINLTTIDGLQVIASWDKKVSGGVVFSPNGKSLAAKLLADIYLYDVISGKEVGYIPGTYSGVKPAFSPDSRFVASTLPDELTVAIWDASSMELIQKFEGHENSVKAVAYSPRGQFLASASLDQSIRIWDAISGKLVQKIEAGANVLSVCFSPDGSLLAAGLDYRLEDGSAGNQIINIWSVSDAKVQRTLIQGHPVNDLIFSPNGKMLATGSGNKVYTWSIEDNRWLYVLEGIDSQVSDIAFSPDGSLLAASGYYDNKVMFWQMDNGKPVLTLYKNQAYQSFEVVMGVHFSPDGRFFATSSIDHNQSGHIDIWGVLP